MTAYDCGESPGNYMIHTSSMELHGGRVYYCLIKLTKDCQRRRRVGVSRVYASLLNVHYLLD